MTKRFFLVLLAMLMVLSVFTACDDDDDDDSRACTEEDLEIIGAIMDACSEAMEDDDYFTYSISGTTYTITLKTYTCTVESYIDDSDISVTIKSGSTCKAAFNSSYTSITYNISATVDGTSHSLYMKETYDDPEDDPTSSKIKLDGVEITGFYDMFDDLYSAARELASRTLAI